MDFKKRKLNQIIKNHLVNELNQLQSEFSIIQKENQESVNVIEINIETFNSIGLIIIYEDEYIFFNYLNKNDNKLINENWSEKFKTIDDILHKIDNFVNCLSLKKVDS